MTDDRVKLLHTVEVTGLNPVAPTRRRGHSQYEVMARLWPFSFDGFCGDFGGGNRLDLFRD